VAWFYEIRSSNNALLKQDGGFATQDPAKMAAREAAKKMKNLHQGGWQALRVQVLVVAADRLAAATTAGGTAARLGW
jgi:hypothetical protein